MSLRFLTAGESHGPGLVMILEGLPSGIEIDISKINHQLSRRQKGAGAGKRMDIETDSIQILSGIMQGKTTGAPVSVIINNADHKNWQGKEIEAYTIPRPGHADLTAALKYNYNDFRCSLERASARETAARVAAGAFCQELLELFNINVIGYVTRIGNIRAKLDNVPPEKRKELAVQNKLSCPEKECLQDMESLIDAVSLNGDTLGGEIEILGLNVPPGLGSHVHWDRKLDGRLAQAVMSIPSVKSISFGDVVNNESLYGSSSQDQIIRKNGKLDRKTNHNGGIEGGISNGDPIRFQAVLKPIATTKTAQNSIDFSTGMETKIKYERSDSCHVPRAVPILEAMTAFILADTLVEKLGGDSIKEMKKHFEQLPVNPLMDFSIDPEKKVFWE